MQESLSPSSRLLTRATAVAFGLLGVVMFVAPAWSAERFPWAVSHFVAMTIGGWSIGNAVLAWQAAHVWRWGSVYASLRYLWAFAALQVGVLVWFHGKVDLGVALAWPYVGTLALALVTAAVGVADVARLRPHRGEDGLPAPAWVRGLWVFFAVFVGFLAAVAAVAPKAALSGRVFPEPLTPFTLRAFGAFYLALVLGTVGLVRARSMGPTTTFLSGGQGLIVPTTAAAFVYWSEFHFREHHLQALYPVAYVGAFLLSMAVLAWERRRKSRSAVGGEAAVPAT